MAGAGISTLVQGSHGDRTKTSTKISKNVLGLSTLEFLNAEGTVQRGRGLTIVMEIGGLSGFHLILLPKWPFLQRSERSQSGVLPVALYVFSNYAFQKWRTTHRWINEPL